MRKIQACDSIKLTNSIDEIWNVLIDIPSYQKWWPKVIDINVSNYSDKITGTDFVVKPFGGQSFSCRIESIVPMNEINLFYFDGLYRGKGNWDIKSYNNLANVSYSVDLIIVNKFVIALSYILPVAKIHSIVFKKIFSGLRNYLSNRQI
ncbi:MAG: SRPBCC family protein [Ignavibacteriaceae bacterium]